MPRNRKPVLHEEDGSHSETEGLSIDCSLIASFHCVNLATLLKLTQLVLIVLKGFF